MRTSGRRRGGGGELHQSSFRVLIRAALKQKAHCEGATREAAPVVRAKRYLAVHEQVPYAPGKVLVLQLRVLVRDVLADPSQLQNMTPIQIPGGQKGRKTSEQTWVGLERECGGKKYGCALVWVNFTV